MIKILLIALFFWFSLEIGSYGIRDEDCVAASCCHAVEWLPVKHDHTMLGRQPPENVVLMKACGLMEAVDFQLIGRRRIRQSREVYSRTAS